MMQKQWTYTYLLAILSFIIVFSIAVGSDYYNFCIDSNIHAKNIREWTYNGASDLIIEEGAFLYRCILAMGMNIRPTFILRIWLFVSSIAIIVCVGIWTWRLLKASLKFVWFIVFLDISICILFAFDYFTIHYRLDYNFLAAAITAFTAILFLNSDSPKVRYASWLVFLTSLVHIIYMRNNAVLTLPVYFFAAVIHGTKIRTGWKVGMVSIGMTLAVYGGIMLVMPVGTHPHLCMMITDMKIASILTGDFNSERGKIHNAGFCITSYLDSEQNDTEEVIIPEPFVTEYGRGKDEACSSLYDMYVSEWKERPLAMATARSILIVQFFHAGYVPLLYRELVAIPYSEFHSDNPAWEVSKQAPPWVHDVTSFGASAAQHYFRPIVYAIALMCLIRYVVCRKRLNFAQQAAILLAVVAFTYLLSFMVAVPTADNRYHTPVLFMIFCFLSYVSAHAIVNRRSQLQ